MLSQRLPHRSAPVVTGPAVAAEDRGTDAGALTGKWVSPPTGSQS